VVLIDFWPPGANLQKRDAGYQKLLDQYGSRGFAIVGFKFDTMMDMEDQPSLRRNRSSLCLAVAPDDLKQKLRH